MQCHPAEIALTEGIGKKWLKIIASNVLQGRGESSVWMLRFAQHDRRCHSERSEESSVDASLRSCFAQHDRRCHSERSEESSVGVSRSSTGQGWQTSPSCPSPSKGEGRFGIAETG